MSTSIESLELTGCRTLYLGCVGAFRYVKRMASLFRLHADRDRIILYILILSYSFAAGATVG